MNITLPEPIATYFRTKGGADPDETLACFAPTATVVDAGEEMEMIGHDAIRKWMSGTVASYNLTTEVTRAVEEEGKTIVSALVSGDFPGSPIEFDYDFTLRDGKIERLEIR